MRRRRTYRLPDHQMQHLVGVSATFDGDCTRCAEPILVGQRVIKARDGWMHARCANGGDE